MNNHPTVTSSIMQEEVLQGLHGAQKSLPSKYFYDERGSRLFDQITRLDEYYLTRAETTIMKKQMPQIIRQTGSIPVLVELGSGSSRKTRLLLDHLPEITAYVPVEISERYLTGVVRSLRDEYPELTIRPVCADYTQPFQIPPLQNRPYNSSRILFYPGSTIGNFRPGQARRFLEGLTGILNPGGGLLIGVDLAKDTEILEAAYNDRQGITAQFNKNILLHINREVSANFNPDHFEHFAFYNREEGRIEMHLISGIEHTVYVAGKRIRFKKGESIHTENSYKYTLAGFEELVDPWYSVKKVWTDEHDYFSLQYLKLKKDPD